jgi:TPR repeat protein
MKFTILISTSFAILPLFSNVEASWKALDPLYESNYEVRGGCCFRDTVDIRREALMKRAADNDPDALYQLATDTYESISRFDNQSIQEMKKKGAINQFRVAAENGSSEAYVKLGQLLDDPTYFEKAAELENSEAKLLIATLYLNGSIQWSYPKNLVKAVQLYESCAKNGYKEAIEWLFKLGSNVLEQFAEIGDSNTQVSIARYYIDRKSNKNFEEKAIQLYRSAAGSGNELAIQWLKDNSQHENGSPLIKRLKTEEVE